MGREIRERRVRQREEPLVQAEVLQQFQRGRMDRIARKSRSKS
jgi:hypothetical protein